MHNHAPHIAAMDLFVVPSLTLCSSTFWSLSGWLRELVSMNVTAHPTAEWIAQQITEAFPWNEAPHLIRDRDGIYGAAVRRRLRAMGIRDKPIAPGSPWQNAFAERLIGSIRREFIVSGLLAPPSSAPGDARLSDRLMMSGWTHVGH